MNKIPKPATISPNVLRPLFLERSGIAPTNVRKARYLAMFKPPETMKVVTVVPMLAPIIQAQAWKSVIVPISANLTRVTAVTSDDWANAEWNNP